MGNDYSFIIVTTKKVLSQQQKNLSCCKKLKHTVVAQIFCVISACSRFPTFQTLLSERGDSCKTEEMARVLSFSDTVQ